jgi:GGDEF domain-containing protein
MLINRLQGNLDAHNAKRKRRYKLSLGKGIERYDPECPRSIDELLAMADNFMYEQKLKGPATVREALENQCPLRDMRQTVKKRRLSC